mgnify:CR=1 FL=1
MTNHHRTEVLPHGMDDRIRQLLRDPRAENPAPGVQFALVPFKIRVGEREYVDLATLNTQQMLQAMTDYNGASTTACPSPEEWARIFFRRRTTCLPSPSAATCPAATMPPWPRREMVLEEHPEKKIFVLDTLSCSGALAGAAELANKLIGEDQAFDDICFALKKFADSTHILFALASFDNLAKNGRVNRVVGFIAGRLNMRVLGRRTPDGKIDFFFRPAARPACWQRFWSRWTKTNTMVSIRCSSASAAIRTPPSFCITH